MNDGAMSKVQIALLLGVISLFAPCIPCVGWPIYGILVLVTLVVGVMAHREAAESGEATGAAKIGMGLTFLPGMLLVLFSFGYTFLVLILAMMESM